MKLNQRDIGGLIFLAAMAAAPAIVAGYELRKWWGW